MIVHKLLFGEGAYLYLPFALARLRELEAIDPDGFFSQTFTVNDATINVRQERQYQYIKITVGGGFYFEFVSTGNPIVVESTQLLGSWYNAYSGVVVSTEVKATEGNIVTKPTIRNQRRMKQNDPYENFSITQFPIQIQYYNENARYRQVTQSLRNLYMYPMILYSTSAPIHSYTGLGTRSAALYSNTFTQIVDPGGGEVFTQRDYGYDVRWGYSVGTNPQTEVLIEGNADWPRQSAYQTVVDEKWGTRSFGIIIDAFCQIQVFPIGAITPLTSFTQNVIDTYVKRNSPTYPSWCHLPTARFLDEIQIKSADQILVEQPEINWEFNHLGTKAVAVIYGRSPYENDTAFWEDDPDPDTPWTQTKFDDHIIPLCKDNTVHRGSGLVAAGYLDTARYFYGAGVVELTITITLTGDRLEDYDLTVDVVDVRNPNTSSYSAVLAGYSFIDIPASGVSAGDMLIVDIEGYNNRSATTDTGSRRELISVKNATMGTEAMCVYAYPILGADISTMSFAFKLRNLNRSVGPISTPTRSTYTGSSALSVYYVRETFGVWVVHSGTSKGITYPETMTAEFKEEIAALARLDGRAQITEHLAANPHLDYVPLAFPHDGWVTTDAQAVRDHWSRDQHFWYNEPWVLYDDYTVHGSGYPDQGWVRYRNPPGSPPANIDALYWEVYGWSNPTSFGNGHLFFCTDPRWGWNYYAGMVQKYMMISAWTTFFTHPNGSYAFWCDQLVYNAFGIPNFAQSSPTSFQAFVVDALSVFEVDQLEHCIIDRVHLEVRKPSGKAASLDTTFLELYNRAVVAGKDAKTLEENINELTVEDMRGTFEKGVDTTYQCTTGEYQDVLELKFTWHQKEYYFQEPMIAGNYVPASGEPTTVFGPLSVAGNIVSLNLNHHWYENPRSSGIGDRVTPSFVDTNNPTSLPFRFTNPLIITG